MLLRGLRTLRFLRDFKFTLAEKIDVRLRISRILKNTKLKIYLETEIKKSIMFQGFLRYAPL